MTRTRLASRVSEHRSLVANALLVLLFTALALPSACAWGNGGYSADENNPDTGTHDWIAEEALALQTADVGFLAETYHSRFLLGTEAPDNPAYIGDTSEHHVYFYGSGELQDGSCADRASAIYDIALGYLEANNLYAAAYEIGVMAHYVSDVGVFGHTMGTYTDWGAEVHHSDYEDSVNSRLDSISSPTGISLGDIGAHAATLDLAENVTFGYGSIQSNVWMDGNYGWSNGAFEASAIASLYASVEAVASVINHLLTEAYGSGPPPLQPPEPPASLTATVRGSEIVLAWAPPIDDGGAAVTSYRLYRGATPEDYMLLATVSGTTFAWTDEDVERGRTYYYWVVAVNSEGSSDMIRLASASVPKDSSSLLIAIIVSAASASFASAGFVLWRRRRRSGG